jgi:stage V sporulation protein AB
MTVILTVFIGTAGGLAIGASITAFFTVLGIPARIIQWSRNKDNVLLYEICLVTGALVSCLIYFFDFSLVSMKLPSMKILSVPFGFILGTFVGMIAAALTETLDIISVAANKLKIVRWIYLIVVVILLGKIIGSLLYFIVPGFF